MYQLTAVDGYKYSSSDTYVLEILPVATGLAAIASDQTLSLFDPTRLNSGPLKQVRTNHKNLTCAKVYDPAESIVCTAGENGTVSIWDLRTNPIKSAMQIGEKGNTDSIPILSLACSSPTTSLAAGTELANHQASILIWDLRNPLTLKIQYNEVHSDDITELTFHPTTPNLLLSGSTDGLVNISDTLITDEDDLVLAAFNHGSVHHAGFLNQGTEIYAASHDEKFALYDMSEQTPEKGSALLDMGDIREAVGCQYLANVVPKLGNAGAVVGVGSQDQEMFQLVHLAKGPNGQWGLDRDTVVGLPGAHGQELVRSFVFYDEQQLVVTGGEDGCIKSWRAS